MSKKLARELKKLSEYYTKKTNISSLGNGQFSMPNTHKRIIAKKIFLFKQENKNKLSTIRVGKNFQALVPEEPDYSSENRDDILIIIPTN